MITGTTSDKNYLQQVLVAYHNGHKHIWQRATNGGRGESNAWFLSDTTNLDNTLNNYPSQIVGEVIVTPLTDVDKVALSNNEKPLILIQKTTKQWSSRQQNIGADLVVDVLNQIDITAGIDITQLEQYRIDGRRTQDKSATKKSEPIINVVQVETTTEERHMNALTIPTKDEISWYIPRTFNGVSEYEIYEHARKTRKPILLEGHAGTGKTSSATYYAYQKQVGISIQSCSAGLQLSDMVGKTAILPSGEAGWVDGALTRAMRYGGGYVLDEIDFAQPKVLQRLQDVATNYRLELHENNGEVVHAHPDFFLVATYNNGYKHSNQLNEAVLDRYKIKMYFDYDRSIEKQVVQLPTLLDIAYQMRNNDIDGTYKTPVSLRMLKSFQELALDLNYEFAVNNFVMCFHADERQSVKLLFEAYASQLEEEVSTLKESR